MKVSHGRFAVLAVTLALSVANASAADVVPDNQRAPTSAVEPALKELEERAAQSKAGEAAVVDEVLARVTRMSATVAELHTLIEAIPAPRCPPASTTAACPPSAAATPAAPSPPPAVAPVAKPAATPAMQPPVPADEPPAGLPWQPVVAGLAILVLLGLLWRQRRQKKAAATPFTATQPSPPPVPEPPVAQEGKVSPGGTPPPPPAIVPPSVQPPTAQQTPQPAAAGEAGAEPAAADADLSLELAEVMLSMGLTEGAAQTLTDHIHAQPRQALFHWLKLLDIYRKSGMKNDFERSAQEIQQYFNMAPPDWEPADGTTKPPDLESYAHVINRVQELWPRRSCAEYLSRLLEDNRGGTRTGFPQAVIEEILLLVALLKDLGQ